MRKLLCALLIATSLGQIQSKYDPNRPQAKPNQELSTYKSIMRNIWDFCLLESLGVQAVSEENETYIRSIIHELNMDDYCIEIRGMSNYAKALLGRTNAFVLPSLFFKKSHACLYISEDWFNTLSIKQKEALIKHELMHIKQNHITQKVLFSMGTSVALSIFTQRVSQALFEAHNYRVPKYSLAGTFIKNQTLIQILTHISLTNYYSKLTEKDADIQAAKTMDDKNGFVDLFNEIKDEVKDPESKFIVKRVISKLLSPITTILFGSHPELDERIAYIQELE